METPKKTAENPDPEAVDVSFANTLRNALSAADKKGGAVIGHEDSGMTMTNSSTRFLTTDKQNGARNKWIWSHAFSAAGLRDLLGGKYDLTNVREELTLKRFFGEECWQEMDLLDHDAFVRQCRDKLAKAVEDKTLIVVVGSIGRVLADLPRLTD